MAVIIASTCGFPASIRLAISCTLSWVPVERKCTDPSLSLVAGSAELDDDVDAAELDPERFAASLFSRRRRAIRSMTMFVIIALAGLFQLPPRRSVYCAITGAHATSISEINKQQRLNRDVVSFIPVSYLDPNQPLSI